uniref:uncharacterized protein LOC104265701 isoform X2 n=1 Tax=Ciona intestinalis TaxID=7719 RepID=UPI000EF514E5|nr:uncharacterized protein LOC104265701 isoform X2 [Ciona intestinalis]|eukprot:XP_026695342.1 uncharacterized protein LOC104265701 isoform X2 [Ciona intestinalis]
MSNCCIPNCFYSYSKKNAKRSLFTIRRPDLARSSDEKDHRERLTNFILGLRDFQRGDRIKEILKKEKACICEAHFKPEDIVSYYHSRKELKCGAFPSENLPKKCGVLVKESRERVTRKPLPDAIRHSCIEKVYSSFSKLSSQTRGLSKEFCFY